MRKKNKKKIRIALIFGGRSAEHEVSLQSAKNIFEAMDKNKYEVSLVGIGNDGKWRLSTPSQFLLNANDPETIKLNEGKNDVALVPVGDGAKIANLSRASALQAVDVVFPVLHGPFGEDGTVQGVLKLAGVPFVGAGVLGSAVGMDKDVTKRLLRDAGIPIANFIVLKSGDKAEYDDVIRRLGAPFFVKPANLGSSVGVSKVKNGKQFKEALKDAFSYDSKVLVEEYVRGREVECAVLGNEMPIASLPGEVLPKHEFYSYEAKYLDENGAMLEIPAKLSQATIVKVQEMAVLAFRVLCSEGMARADFFIRDNGEVLLNEINTIPGFTKISMYPKLWEASGLSYSKLIDKLVELAIERFQKEKKLKTSYM